MGKGNWYTDTAVLWGAPYQSTCTANIENNRYLFDVRTTETKMLSNSIVYGIAEDVDIAWNLELNARELHLTLVADAKPMPVSWQKRINVIDFANTLSIKKLLWHEGDDRLSAKLAVEVGTSAAFSIAAGRNLELAPQRYGYISVELGSIVYRNYAAGGFASIVWGMDLTPHWQLNWGMHHRIKFRNTAPTLPRQARTAAEMQLLSRHINPALASVIRYDLNKAANILNMTYDQHVMQIGVATTLAPEKVLRLDWMPQICSKRQECGSNYMIKLTIERKF